VDTSLELAHPEVYSKLSSKGKLEVLKLLHNRGLTAISNSFSIKFQFSALFVAMIFGFYSMIYAAMQVSPGIRAIGHGLLFLVGLAVCIYAIVKKDHFGWNKEAALIRRLTEIEAEFARLLQTKPR
jgi:hypothetical protein